MGILMETSNAKVGSNGYRKPELFIMGAPSEVYADVQNTITSSINSKESEYRRIVEQIPITLKTYKQSHVSIQPATRNGYTSQLHLNQVQVPAATFNIEYSSQAYVPSTSTSPAKEETKDGVVCPPKKKWIKEYLEEPKLPVRLASVSPCNNGGVVRPSSPAVLSLEPSPLLDYSEHSRPRTSSYGHTQIPSPPSVGSNSNGSCSNGSTGSNGVPRAGTREVHNKLEKNRRAHLKECFELLKRQLPATADDKKTSNLSILGSAIRYVQVLRRKERECEHEMERLAREKIAAQQRLAALKRELSIREIATPNNDTTIQIINDKDDKINGQVLGIPIGIPVCASVPSVSVIEASPQVSVRSLPIQITPTTSQVVRTSYGSRQNTLTFTTLTPADSRRPNGLTENGVNATISTTALVHPTQIHLPISQMVSGGVVVGNGVQILSPGLRVLHATHINGVKTSENNRLSRENGITISPPPSTDSNGPVLMNGLTPLVVSQPTQLLHTHTHKMVETHVMNGSVTPLTVSTQYLNATSLVKPMVVVTTTSS